MSLSGSLPVVKPTFSADFVNTERVDHRLTFARASTATFYDGVTTAKAEENLLIRSQELSQATVWVFPNTSVSVDATTAPDGTTTADLFYPTTTGTNRGTYQTNTSAYLTTAVTKTFSIYAKANGIAHIYIQDATNGGQRTWFNVSAGTVGTTAAGYTASIENVGSGWYRCICTTSAAWGANATVGWYLADADNNITATTSGTNGVYLWGAQLEQRSSVTAYTATTTAPITNYIHAMRTATAGVGRIAHDPITRETLGLHMESAATNLLTYSDDFANAAWAKTRSSITSNTIIAPDGTLTGDKLLENTDNNTHILLNNAAITLSIGVAYTYSIYAKAAGRTICRLGNNDLGGVFFDLSSGAITSVGSGFSGSIQSVGNGWYRLSATQASNSNANGRLVVSLVSAGTTTSYTGDGYSGIYIWGAQLEAGSLATSYIPTVASQVTRAADTCTLAAPQFDAAIRQGEGTLYAEVLPTSASGSFDFGIANLENGTYSNLALRKTAGVFVGYGNNNGVAQFDLQLGTDVTVPYGVAYKSAVAYAVNNFGATSQGLITKTDSLGVPPEVSSLRVGPDSFTSYFRYNNYIRKVAYYPTRLANLNLEALTL